MWRVEHTDADVSDAATLPPFVERVLETVELIPAGSVWTYGDIAEFLGEQGPRQVGRVLALYGGGLPWWRVVRADGRLLPGREQEALAHYRAEGTPLREVQAGQARHGHRLRMVQARWWGPQ